MRETLGLIGIGLLGSALAERLLQAGFAVRGFDLDPARREILARLGGDVAESAPQVVVAADRILLSLPDSPCVIHLIAELTDHLRAGQTIIDTTTGNPTATAALGQQLGDSGVHYLDATVAGSSEQARQGDIVLTVGGTEDAVADCRDIFDALARRTFHVGPCGSGARMKLVTNLVLGLNRAVLAEGLAFASRQGLDLTAVLEVLREGAAYSTVMDTKGQKMISGDFAVQARLSQHLKDVRLILEQGEQCAARLPLSEVHRQLLEAAMAAGLGDADNSAIVQVFNL